MFLDSPSPDKALLADKIKQMEDVLEEKNLIEKMMHQQLQQLKTELENEKQAASLQQLEREQLEQQLAAVDRDNYYSFNELNLLQERLQEMEKNEQDLKLEKAKLLNLVRENNEELTREKAVLQQRLLEQESVIQVQCPQVCWISI